ncbi:hypothetical protein CMO93_05845 [Candidatus Woesearchaeota archaeon]|nr:hypothetical protein [Candidatus Woesearchaeota archaeon]|tara:strand:- start:6362 stop:7135 length:774 start_codon:yes stop_codon:yes gene_type:complete
MKNSDYHAIILAAGNSERLRELTKDKPKSFLEINNKKIIDYHLDFLSQKGIEKVTIVVGYLKDLFIKAIGTSYKNIEIDYVISEEYANTGHGWSIFLTRDVWQKQKKPVILLHADIFYDLNMLDKVLNSKDENVIIVDNSYDILTGDEVIVTGKDGIMTGFKWGIKKEDNAAGELIGVNKWSPKFMEQYYKFMDDFFRKNGKKHNYEPVLDRFIKEKHVNINYINSNGLPWININYKEDYLEAKNKIYPSIYNKGTK